MNYRSLFMLFLVAGLILSAGCISSKDGQTQSAQEPQATLTPSTQATVASETEKSVTPGSDTIIPASTQSPSSTTVGTTSSTIVKAPDMAGFISGSFLKVTETYIGIKKSRGALDWKKVQEQALALQIQVQDLKKTYMLDVPNPEKTVFPGLNSREQIVFLKYIRYLNDMESFATNLKNAVYYQEKGGDPDSLQTAHRYQNLADQFEKQAIAEVKTISDYCTDFKYSFMNPVSVQEYRYV
nr:hypothetical protein [uncultured Methanospirillum sp.]